VDIETATQDPIDAGQDALARGAWEQARDFFEAAVSQAESPVALEGLSWAAWWCNDTKLVFEARERAYRLYRAQDDQRGAARMATWLGTDYVDFYGELAVGWGWLRRARRLLDDLEPGPEHGWLFVHEAEKHLFAHETGRARELGTRATKLGRRLGLVDLEMMGLAAEGLALVTEGEITPGMSRLDEATAAALGEDFPEILPIGWCWCYMIHACELVRDYDRAAQWCRRLEEWSARMRVEFLNRSCRATYAGILVLRGTWEKAEQELKECADRLAVIRPLAVADATVRLGELRRRQGRLGEAAEIFEQTAEHPLALLGLAEVCLDQGDAARARDRAEQYLREAPSHAVTLRSAGLELLVRAQAALGEPLPATAALEELEGVARLVATAPLRASACFAAGILASATGDSDRARTAFEDATRLFQRSGAPFEAARARIELARALAELSRDSDAVREVRAAATSLRRIGAAAEASRADALTLEFQRGPSRDDSPLTRRECEVLRLVADGHSDRAVAMHLVLSEHTVHRHVANILTKLDCASRSAAVAEALRRGLI
jgi:DNA-binding NarL/FixJ family response regulator